MIALEVGNLDGLVFIIFSIMLGPPIIMSIIGISVKKSNPKASNVLFILSGIYLLIGLGLCGGVL